MSEKFQKNMYTTWNNLVHNVDVLEHHRVTYKSLKTLKVKKRKNEL